ALGSPALKWRDTHRSAPSALAARARSLGVGRSSPRRRRVGSAPRSASRSARSVASRRVASASTSPPGPTLPGSSGPWPGSIAILEPAHVLGLANDRAARPGHRGAQALERGQRSRADDSVGRLAHVELELGDRVGGPGAEDAVLLADLEAERVEAPLELADVVAPERGGTQVQDAVPQTVAGLDELAPGLAPDHAVRREPSLLLERSDGGLGRRPEPAVELVGVDPVSELEKTMLDVANGIAGVGAADDPHAAPVFGALGRAATEWPLSWRDAPRRVRSARGRKVGVDLP